MILAFIDEMRVEGYAVESILRVLSQQGLRIAACTYRSWKQPARIAVRTVTDALVEDKIRELAWTLNPATGQVPMTPEGLYGRRKWVALLRRQEGLAGTFRGAVDRAMRTLGLEGIRRVKKIRTTIPGPDGRRAGDLLNRDFTAPAPTEPGVGHRLHLGSHLGGVRLRRVRRGRVRSADRGLARLDVEGIAASIGTVGDASDNALMETVNGLFKTEWIRTTVFHHGPFRTLSDVEFATAGWVDWYNNRRLHGSPGMLTPVESETLHHEALT